MCALKICQGIKTSYKKRFMSGYQMILISQLIPTPPVCLQDITSLLHTIYEVVDASVNHSPSSSKTLRVKLSVAPDSSQRWRSCTQGAAGKASMQ